MTAIININRLNNFDIIRLLAALQVVVFHSYEHLSINSTTVNFFIKYFFNFLPGVPIFFFISGFLIYASFDRHSERIVSYFKNRVLRIFPGLWFCFLLTILLLIIDYPNSFSDFLNENNLFEWTVAQISLLQFYTPDFLRYWGVGTPNGSLWTITVEFQFYVLVPFIFYLLRKFRNSIIPLFLLFLISAGINYYIGTFPKEDIYRKLGGVLVLSYLYYFLIGIGIYLNWNLLKKYFENNFLNWFVIYLLYMLVTKALLGFDTSSYWIESPLNIIATILLAGATFSAAFTNNNLSSRLLKGNDISYGIYIYHMLVVNFLVHRNIIAKSYLMLVVLIVTVFLAYISWRFIEKPSLNLKNK